MSKSYELNLHWKQGDDFGTCLENSKGNVPDALRLWSDSFKSMSKHCEQLADFLSKDKSMKSVGDTHHIEFVGDVVVLDKAVKNGLLDVVDFDEE